MKVWARYAVPVLVDEHQDTIERIVMVPGERFIDRETRRATARETRPCVRG